MNLVQIIRNILMFVWVLSITSECAPYHPRPRNFLNSSNFNFVHPCPKGELLLKGMCRKVYDEYDKESAQFCSSTAGFTTCTREFLLPNKPLRIENYRAYLEFSQGDLDQLPSGVFRQLPEVTTLQISRNKLRTLEEDSLKGLQDLKKLNLYDNQIASIGRVFKHCKKLEVLNLGMNKITTVDKKAFKDLTNLKELNLAFNLLTSTPSTINSLIELKILLLNNNKINTLESKFLNSLKKLEKLDLSDNQLSQIPRNAFEGLKNLKELNLNSNYLSSVDVDNLVSNLKSLSVLRISINSFSCTTLEDVIAKLKRKNIEVAKGHSKSPSNVQGISCLVHKI